MPPFRQPCGTFLSLFATVALLAGCDDCPDASACVPPAIIRLNLPAAASSGATVVACHVADCATATLPAAAAPGSGADLSFSRADVEGSLVTRADGSLQLVVRLVDVSRDDRVTIVVSDPAGVELASLDEMVSFPAVSLSSGACLPCPTAHLGDPA
jgi:hypothetical protein